MAHIRERIQQEVQVREHEVREGSDVFVLRGTPDAEILSGMMYMTEQAANNKAKHWTTALQADGHLSAEEKISPDMVKEILIVTRALQPPEGQDPFDEVEIAALSKKEGVLFVKLLAGSLYALGLTGDPASNDPHSTLDAVTPGNSRKPAASSSTSTSGSSTGGTRRRKGS